MRPAEKEGQSQVAEREVVRENLGSSQAGFRLHPRLLSHACQAWALLLGAGDEWHDADGKTSRQ